MVHVSESEDSFNFLRKAAALFTLYRRTVLVISAVLLILIVLFSGNRSSSSLYWPGWYVLKIGPDNGTGRIDEELENAGITGFVSAGNSWVDYMDIPRMKQLPVSEIDDVILPGDPRRDPYLSVVHELFESGDSSLVYLPSGPGIRHYRRILGKISGWDNWTLMDDIGASPGLAAFLIFSSLAFLIAFTAGGGPFSISRLISILPLSLLILSGNPGMVFPLLLTFFLSPVNFKKRGGSRGKFFTAVVYTGYTAAAASMVNSSAGVGIWALAAALLSSEIIALATPFLKKHPRRASAVQQGKKFFLRKRREHQLFVPLSLMQPAHRTSRLSQKTAGSFLAAGFTLAAFFLPADFGTQAAHTPIPHALPAESGFDNLSSFTALDGARNALSLPDAALMLSSAAFQEGFLFGSDFRLPRPGDSLTIRGFSSRGDGISVTETVVKNYDKSWFESVLSRELSQGAGLLFASLGGPSSVFSISSVPGIEETRLNRIQIALYGIAVLVMLLLTIFPDRGDAPVRSIYKPIMNARRRAQAA